MCSNLLLELYIPIKHQKTNNIFIFYSKKKKIRDIKKSPNQQKKENNKKGAISPTNKKKGRGDKKKKYKPYSDLFVRVFGVAQHPPFGHLLTGCKCLYTYIPTNPWEVDFSDGVVYTALPSAVHTQHTNYGT